MDNFDPRQIFAFGAAIVRDLANGISYGVNAPKVSETIWVRPADIERYIYMMPDGLRRRNASGRVIDFKATKLEVRPLSEAPQIRACYQRWRDNIPWDQTAEFSAILGSIARKGRSVRCRTEDDLRRRYRILDELFEEVAQTRKLKTRKQLNRFNFREFGSVQVAIDPHGRPLLGKVGGFHRIALAKILEIDIIPAELGLVDVNAIPMLDRYRQPPRIRKPLTASAHLETCGFGLPTRDRSTSTQTVP